jgi:hypothetical protein
LDIELFSGLSQMNKNSRVLKSGGKGNAFSGITLARQPLDELDEIV